VIVAYDPKRAGKHHEQTRAERGRSQQEARKPRFLALYSVRLSFVASTCEICRGSRHFCHPSVRHRAASAAKSADEKLSAPQLFPKGTSDARWRGTIHKGTPGGCAIPRPRATQISSPLSSQGNGGSERPAIKEERRKKHYAAQSSWCPGQKIVPVVIRRSNFNAVLAEG